MESDTTARLKKRFAAAKPVLRALILVLVVWGVYRAGGNAVREMQSRREKVAAEIEAFDAQIGSAEPTRRAQLIAERDTRQAMLAHSPWSARPGWLALAAACYLLGLLPNAIFWRSILRALGARPGWRETMRAYYIGHLGKYVPGKAMVVVLRTSLVAGEKTPATIAAVAVFVETLTMMSVGGTLAALVLGALFRDQVTMLALAIGMAVMAGLPTLPPVFRRIVRFLKIKRADSAIDASLRGLNYSLMIKGWIWVALGWVLLGLSLWATLRALPMVEQTLAESWSQLPLLTACVALAVVLGFISLLPGGAGVREWVVMTLVAPLPGIGAFPALAAAVWLRVIWLMSEFVISFILYGVGHTPRPAEAAQDGGQKRAS